MLCMCYDHDPDARSPVQLYGLTCAEPPTANAQGSRGYWHVSGMFSFGLYFVKTTPSDTFWAGPPPRHLCSRSCIVVADAELVIPRYNPCGRFH
jgi:hypothetical protein